MVIFTIIGVIIAVIVLGSFLLGMAGIPIAQDSIRTKNTYESKREELLGSLRLLYEKFINQEEIDFNDALHLSQLSYAMLINERINSNPNYQTPSVRRMADIINLNYDNICEMYGEVNFKQSPQLAKALIDYSLKNIELFVE